MTIELTDAQQRKIEVLIRRIDSACKGSLKTQNLVRMIHVEIAKAQRRAKRSTNAKAKMKVQSTKIVEQ